MLIDRINITHVVINEHGAIFDELIDLLTDCLQVCGVQVSRTINKVDPTRLNVIVGHTIFLAPDVFARIRRQAQKYILFQIEALDCEHGFFSTNPAYLEFLIGAKQVWDYSPQNIQFLAHLGVTNARYIPLGHSPRLERITDPCATDVDILFFGATRERRVKIMDELQRRDIRAMLIFNMYGRERDTYIARAKIQLNIHQFETSQLEQVRLSYLLNNKRFIISESAANNPYGDGVVFCEYKELVDRCEYFLRAGMETERSRIAKIGYERLKQIPTANSVKNALAEWH